MKSILDHLYLKNFIRSRHAAELLCCKKPVSCGGWRASGWSFGFKYKHRTQPAIIIIIIIITTHFQVQHLSSWKEHSSPLGSLSHGTFPSPREQLIPRVNILFKTTILVCNECKEMPSMLGHRLGTRGAGIHSTAILPREPAGCEWNCICSVKILQFDLISCFHGHTQKKRG